MGVGPYEIRDPIHGLVELSQKEVNLINTSTFQRLRRIRQLAMAFLVYPGTLHTRFDHSIGVMHIAGRISDQLKQREPKKITEKDCERIRLAALLHDIGHGPFSHVSEHLLANQVSEKSIREKIHEKVTVDIIKNDSEICDILTDEERKCVVEMIEGKTVRDFRRDIVSSDLDADKMDYLLRDSYFAGVKYGTYDLDKIIESCRVYWEGEESYLAISDEGIFALEQLLLGKHHMTQQVYSHRVRLISDAMIVRGIELAIQEKNHELKQLYQYDKASEFIKNYVEYHDERLIDILKRCKEAKARDIFERLYGRRLFKMIGELPLKDVDDPIAQRQLLQMGTEQKRQWEKQIAEHLEIDSDYVIVNKLHIRNPNYGSRSYSLNPEAIVIFDEKQSKLKRFSSYTTELISVRPPPDETALETVQVYAPQDGWNTLPAVQRQQNQSQLHDKVQEILLAT
ncbi:MAG: HD domain-containing protein [Gammaproteobacteria bacterium]|nr:HD domain-containing protein [Gammaproteobacteria bacterium]